MSLNKTKDEFSIVVSNFDPNVTIQVSNSVGNSPRETYGFLLSQTNCPNADGNCHQHPCADSN